MIKKYYSNKKLALINGSKYCEQERKDVYLRRTIYGNGQYQYALMFLREIVSPKAKSIIKVWRYKTDEITNQINIPMKTNSYVDNMPMGASDNPSGPFNEPELLTCPDCNGDRIGNVTDESEYYSEYYSELCDTCEGEGIVIEQVYDRYRYEEKQDYLANQ